MSNFQKKYYYDFKNNSTNQTNTVEIWQDSSSAISSTKVIGAVDPFIVTLPSLENKLQPVRGTGADLNLFATSSLQYMDLYTAAIQEYQVRHYIAGSLNWCGYLDTEIFSSDFSRQKNYNVSMTANDGFALLDRITYVQDSNGTKFTGITSHWNVIKFIIQKLNLPITNLYVAISTSVSDVTNAVSDTTFHNTYAINTNFYNEDGEPFTLREVLEGILKPYGAFIQQSGGNLYITDVNLIAGTDTVMKVYNGTTLNYLSTTTLSKNIGDLSTIKFMSSDQTLNIVSAINKQVVKYSPYIQESIIELKAEDEFSNVLSTTLFGTSPYQWNETKYTTSTNWNNYNNGFFCSLVGVQNANINVNESYLKLTKYASNQADPANLSFVYKSDLPIIIPSNSKLKIEAKAYCRTTDDLNGTSGTDLIREIKLRTRLKIGDKQYYNDVWDIQGEHTGWINSTSTDYSKSFNLRFRVETLDKDPQFSHPIKIDNTWVDLYNYGMLVENGVYSIKKWDYTIPLNSGFNYGQMTFEIYDWDITQAPFLNHDTVKNSVKDIRIKDIKLSIVDSNGNEYSNNDEEYTGKMNAQYKNEGNTIELIQGTSKSGSPIERGAMLKVNGDSYSPITLWTRGGTDDKIESLLLRSFVGNYENKNIELAVKTKLLPTNIGYLTYNNYLSGKKFMPTSLKNDYANNTSEITMQEIFADSLTINNTYS